MADLFVVGLYNGSETTTAVSIGSQVMHMLTVIIVGLAMGATVRIGRAVGAKDDTAARKTVGTTVVFFAGFSVVITAVLLLFTKNITGVMMTPFEAVKETNDYLAICFAGIPFITAYNIISSIFRGAGDSKHTMYFVAVACIVNIVLDFLFIGCFGIGAGGGAHMGAPRRIHQAHALGHRLVHSDIVKADAQHINSHRRPPFICCNGVCSV